MAKENPVFKINLLLFTEGTGVQFCPGRGRLFGGFSVLIQIRHISIFKSKKYYKKVKHFYLNLITLYIFFINIIQHNIGGLTQFYQSNRLFYF